MIEPTVYHYDIYREELGRAYSLFGYALWDPDPKYKFENEDKPSIIDQSFVQLLPVGVSPPNSDARARSGSYPPVQVGDVGFICEGKFHHIVNTLLPKDDPSHEWLRYGLPEHHETLKVSFSDHIDRKPFPPNDLHSDWITKTSLEGDTTVSAAG